MLAGKNKITEVALAQQRKIQQLSPFLLLDYAGPHTFTPGNEKRGVGEHPHRGFETVTIVYS
ncbi:pirin family protein, partial [Salmonella enterica subsp. enterica serovar Kentucky]|nr:pirin family protein [Salmonella enterica subsp. enterica serovar Kentucky]